MRGVRTLEIALRLLLEARDGARAPLELAAGNAAVNDPITFRVEEIVPVDPFDVGLCGKIVAKIFGREIAIDRRRKSADRSSRRDLALRADDHVIRQRLDFRLGAHASGHRCRMLAPCYRVDQPEAPAAPRLACQLGCAKNRGRGRRVDEVPTGRSWLRSTDPS